MQKQESASNTSHIETQILGHKENPKSITQPCFLLLKGNDPIGKTFPIKNGGVIGRGSSANVKLNDTAISREHIKISILDDGRVTIFDLKSRNGMYVNDIKVSKYILSPGDRITVGNTLLKFTYLDEVEKSYQRKLFVNAMQDSLTGAYNKRFFGDILGKEMSFAKRHKTHLGLILIDIDHFKAINDTYGHLTGDQILRALAKQIQSSIRNEDVFARIGGEEFALLLKNTPPQALFDFSERLRQAVSRLKFNPYKDLSITISIGCGILDSEKHDNPDAFISAMDKRLYTAKRSGRNRTVSE